MVLGPQEELQALKPVTIVVKLCNYILMWCSEANKLTLWKMRLSWAIQSQKKRAKSRKAAWLNDFIPIQVSRALNWRKSLVLTLYCQLNMEDQNATEQRSQDWRAPSACSSGPTCPCSGCNQPDSLSGTVHLSWCCSDVKHHVTVSGE